VSTECPFLDLAAAYALNAIDGDERQRFEAHLPGCRACQAAVAEAGLVASELAELAATRPPPDLRAGVLAAISDVEQDQPGSDDQERAIIGSPDGGQGSDDARAPDDGRADVVTLADRRRPGAPIVLALAAAAVIVVAALSFTLVRSGTDGVTIAEVAGGDDAVAAELAGAEEDSGSVTVVWSAELDAVSVSARNLADPGPGRVYELWFVLEDGVAPAGLFTPEDGSFTGVLQVDPLPALGWGVTIEPDGGSDQPTGEILYLAEL
jgi:anti-sigma-K factor RskA